MEEAAMRDRGSMVVLVAMVTVALTVAIGGALVPVVRQLGDQQRAETAADAAALAGVTGGQMASARLASSNGAELVSWKSSGPIGAVTVTVVVRVGERIATARATNGP
jgi:hypothetical protein